jgi:hypothetical protein
MAPKYEKEAAEEMSVWLKSQELPGMSDIRIEPYEEAPAN